MGKTYFKLTDQLDFFGRKIKIRVKSSPAPEEKELVRKPFVRMNHESQIYQSVLASQPQLSTVEETDQIPVSAYLGVLSSSPQAAAVNITAKPRGGYTVGTNVYLNKVTTGSSGNAAASSYSKETIVVSGLQVGGNFKYQFIETGLHDMDVLTGHGVAPADITWLVFWHDFVYKSYDKEHFSKTAETLGINIQFISSKKQFINYLNYKNTGGYSDARTKSKIRYLSVFAHGQTPLYTGGNETQLSFAYQLNNHEQNSGNQDLTAEINFVQSDIASIKEDIFAAGAVTFFYTCNTGTADANGERFAQLWADKTRNDTYAFQNARSNYIFINSSMDQINGAFNFPTNRFDVAISDIINGLREKGHELLDEPGTDALTWIFGEKNRGVAEYIAENLIVYPTSEEWKIKRQRGEDRDHVDEQGNKYGYADKGSVQYPMINNIADDWKIIWKTRNEERGFLMFTPSKGSSGRKF